MKFDFHLRNNYYKPIKFNEEREMKKYAFTIVAALVLSGTWLYWARSKPDEFGAYSLKGFLVLCALYILVSLWGMAGIAISSIKEELETSRERTQDSKFRVSRSSWHYRLNESSAGNSWVVPKGECEYWSLTVFNLITNVPFMGSIMIALLSVGWLVGARPDFKTVLEPNPNCIPFYSGRQNLGPVVCAALIILTAYFVVDADLMAMITIWVAAVILVSAVVILIFWIMPLIGRLVQKILYPLGFFLGTKMCKRIEIVD